MTLLITLIINATECRTQKIKKISIYTCNFFIWQFQTAIFKYILSNWKLLLSRNLLPIAIRLLWFPSVIKLTGRWPAVPLPAQWVLFYEIFCNHLPVDTVLSFSFSPLFTTPICLSTACSDREFSRQLLWLWIGPRFGPFAVRGSEINAAF
jgi:hypothetical protein